MNDLNYIDIDQIKKDISSYNKLRILYWNAALTLAQILHDDEILIFIDKYTKIKEEALSNQNANKILITFNNMLNKKNLSVSKLNKNNLYKIKFLTSGNFYFSFIREDAKFDNYDYDKLIKKFERKILNVSKFDYNFQVLDIYYGKDSYNNSEIIIWIQENNLSLKTYI